MPTNSDFESRDSLGYRLGFSEEGLEPIFKLNAQVIHALIAVAHPLAEELKVMDEEALERFSRSPVCLLDAGFRAADRWPPQFEGVEASAFSSVLPRALAQDLAPTLCLVAWSTLRMSQETGRLLFGMSRECGAYFRSVSMTELPALARAVWGSVTPRWMDRLDVWRRLIGLAKVTPSESRPDVGACALLQVLGELEPGTRVTLRPRVHLRAEGGRRV